MSRTYHKNSEGRYWNNDQDYSNNPYLWDEYDEVDKALTHDTKEGASGPLQEAGKGPFSGAYCQNTGCLDKWMKAHSQCRYTALPNTTTNTTGTYAGKKWSCVHDGSETVVTIKGVRVHGAAKTDINEAYLASHEKLLIVNLSALSLNLKPPVTLAGLPDGFKTLAKYTVKPTEIMVDWADMHAPLLRREFWTELLACAKRTKVTDVMFTCLGGHGRTGTALASMLIANLDWRVLDAAQYVRSQHCRESIESLDQVEYLYYVGDSRMPLMRPRRRPAKAPVNPEEMQTLADLAREANMSEADKRIVELVKEATSK